MPLTEEQRARMKALLGEKVYGKVDDDNAAGVLLSFAEHVRDEFIEADTDRTNLSAQVTNLSAAGGGAAAAVDADVLLDRAENYETRIELSMRDGDLPKYMADELKKLVKADGQPNAFMLSTAAGIDQRPIDLVLNLFKGTKLGVAGGSRTGIQTIVRQVPGETQTHLSAANAGGGAGQSENPLQSELDAMFPDGK